MATSTATPDFDFFSGEDVTVRFTVTNQDVTPNAPLDLTGLSLQFIFNDKTRSLTKSVGSGITITDATNGIFTVTLTNSDTDNIIRDTDIEYEARVTTAGRTSTLKQGCFRVKRSLFEVA